MVLKEINALFPFKKLLKLLLGISVCVQLAIITYNHISGFHVLAGADYFFLRLLRGMVLSLAGGFLIAYPDLWIIQYLNKHFHWNKYVLKRTILQFCFTVVVAILVSTCITLIAHFINDYEEDLMLVLIYNALIFAVCNVIIMVILEAWIFFTESSESKRRTANLERELSQIRFEVLKNQINPHFMFNSLNVLSGLVGKNAKAQQFIDEFSHIYRYVLETIEKPVVTVNEELDFARSYMFLQQIRYGDHLKYCVNIPAHMLQMYLPPLSLQIVLENAIKHNLISPTQPLQIEINHKEGYLIISNNIQLKISMNTATGIGQKNLMKRFAMVSDILPEFKLSTSYYEVLLPLIQEENDEDTDY